MSPNQNLGVSPLSMPRCNSHRTSPIPESPSTQEAWKQLGFGVDTSGISPHALHLFAEMSHSCWVCNGGTALLDFDLGYHMGIRDNGGGDSFGRGVEGLEAVR
ncbi:hypothetical protein L3X38_013228 [Prunus dulcis]|uniref:Uncharacterized protein n=1 Tax=Prunus dulcis TaxID=3755 RepID=A0AAD4ZH48_PRUDU|nr:hypothetical protein L3X38_013228 [Prunus dulcis]